MTSVNTNAAANTALRTLQATNRSLETTQNRISTGLKIGEAKDNAAYWSISTTLKSDNKALSTVKDALGLGAATVDTAYTALNSTIDVLNEIKSKLTAATQSGVDRDVIQSEIAELQKQLKSIADSATFSGENWLSVNSTPASFNPNKTVVASFNRDANGAATIGTIDIDISKIKLYDVNGTTGLLDGDQNAAGFAIATAGTTTADAADVIFGTTSSATFNVVQNGVTKVVTLDLQLATTLGFSGGVINSATEMESLINAGLSKAGITNIAASVSVAGVMSFNSSSAFSMYQGVEAAGNGTGVSFANIGVGGLGANALAPTDGLANVLTTKAVADIDISKAALDTLGVDTAAEIKLQLESYISIVNQTLKSVTSAASSLGSVGSRIELQSTFVTSLLDTIDEGVGNLIDADLNEESTRLQALQVKQQLGVQALGIANQSSQNILSLFQ